MGDAWGKLNEDIVIDVAYKQGQYKKYKVNEFHFSIYIWNFKYYMNHVLLS